MDILEESLKKAKGGMRRGANMHLTMTKEKKLPEILDESYKIVRAQSIIDLIDNCPLLFSFYTKEGSKMTNGQVKLDIIPLRVQIEPLSRDYFLQVVLGEQNTDWKFNYGGEQFIAFKTENKEYPTVIIKYSSNKD